MSRKIETENSTQNDNIFIKRSNDKLEANKPKVNKINIREILEPAKHHVGENEAL